MATDIGELLVKLSADLKNLDSGLKTAKGELAGFQDYASSFAATLKKTLAFAGVAVGLWEIVSALKTFATDAAMVGARTETLGVGMGVIGKNAGISAQSLDFYVQKLKTMGITTQEAMSAVSKFIVQGMPLKKIEELADIARNTAALAGKNTSEAFNEILSGIVTQQPEILRKYMINIGNLDQVFRSATKQMGLKSAQDIDPITKSMIMLEAVLSNTKQTAGAYEAMMGTVGKQMGSLTRYVQEAKNALWEFFKPIMEGIIGGKMEAFKALETWARSNQAALKEAGKAIAEWIKWAIEAIKTAVQWTSKNWDLIKTLAQFIIIAKIAGWVLSLSRAFAGLGVAVKASAVEVGIALALLGKLSALIGGPWKLVITVVLLGLYEAWNAIQRLRAEAGFTPKPGNLSGAIQEGRARDRDRTNKELDVAGSDAASEAQRRGMTPEAYTALIKENTRLRAEGKAMKPWPDVLPQNETAEDRAKREAEAAFQKRLQESKAKMGPGKAAGAKGGKGSGTAGLEDRLLSETLKMLDAKRQAELQESENSLDLLKTTNEKKRAELAQSLAAELISGEDYYQKLQALQQDETAASLALIEKKKQIQIQAHKEAVDNLNNKKLPGFKDLSDDARAIALQTLEAKHRKEMSRLATDAAKAELEGATKVTEELRRQVEVKKQYADTTEGLQIETAQLLGAISEQEAILQRLNLEWKRNKQAALAAGLSPDDPYFAAGEANLEAKKGDALYGNYASQITQGISSLADAITSGGQDLMQAAHGVFKNLFNEAMKPGLEALKNQLVAGFKSLFGSASSGLAGALMGAIALVGMAVTQKSNASFSASGVQSAVTGHEAVRGIIAGDTSIPIGEIGVSLADALVTTNGILGQIESNTRGGSGGGLNIMVDMGTIHQRVKDAIIDIMDEYFRDVYMQSSQA